MTLTCAFLCFLLVNFNLVVSNKTQTPNPRVCVIGAGLAGLLSARYLKDEGIDFTVLESTRYVGGTWRYDPRLRTDENGLPLHTSMYKHLRTNLPKPAMELTGFPLPADAPMFPNGNTYYKYIQDYAKRFDLIKYIKFLHNVILVSREENVWNVKYQNVKTGEISDDKYDFVIVGTGQNHKPNYPKIPGENNFTGTISHSHDYREPDLYKDRRVLIVGAGPSAMDIIMDLLDVCKTLVHSHHSKTELRTPFPKHYVRKPDIREFNATGVMFEDGSYEDIDDVVYCTGYQYYYPFLDQTCGLKFHHKRVTPLHKHMVNINHPTMVLLGLPLIVCPVPVLDVQSKYTAALIKGNFSLPSKEKMMEDWKKEVDIIESAGRPLSELHVVGDKEDDYYAALTEESGVDRVPPYIMKIKEIILASMFENLYTYRNYVFNVIDSENIIRTLENKPETRQ